MRGATISLQMLAPRLLKKSEAAYYCSRSQSTFEGQCPVSPVMMPNGDKRWDVVDLDKWIETLKNDAQDATDDIVGRLG